MLVRQFACPSCGGTAPLSDRPYQECASCNTVGDYDHEVARRHLEWPKHEALYTKLFADRAGCDAEFEAGDLEGYAKKYARKTGELAEQCPGLYPRRASDPKYRRQFSHFLGYWVAAQCLEPTMVRLDRIHSARWNEVALTFGKVDDVTTLWPLVEHALKHFDEMQRISDYFHKPPDDFVADYVKRWSISTAVAEWLGKVHPIHQRELVERFGVSNQYLDATKGKVTCDTCAGTIEVEAGFVTMKCPYCAAEVQEARGDLRAIDRDRMTGQGYERAFGEIEVAMNAQATAIVILDGEVRRKGYLHRMITLRAAFDGRLANFWSKHALPDSPELADAIRWIEHYAARRNIPLERMPYREHPNGNHMPDNVAKLAARLAEVAPGHRPFSITDGDGCAVEVVVDGAIVRIARDEIGTSRRMVEGWLATFR